MIFAKRKGADLKAEEIMRKIKLEESIENRPKSSIIHRQDPWGNKKIVTPEDIRKQRMHLHGHLLNKNDYRLKCSDYLAELYEEFLRMYQLGSEAAKEGKIMRTQVSGKAITGLSFNDWVFESRMTLLWRKKDLKRQVKGGRISKEMYDFHEEIRRKCIEYCDKYISATRSAQITMV